LLKKNEKTLPKKPRKRVSHKQNIMRDEESVFVNKTILELKKFQENCINFTRDEIFKEIGELDKKYYNDLNYWNNIDGTIANIGHIKNDTDIISYSIKRLNLKLNDKKITDQMLNKFYYDLGVSITDKEDIKLGYPPTIKSLLNTDSYKEASRFYFKISNNSKSYPSAMTNLSNILDKYSRNYESILLYDKVLENHPNFGMALGNKALAIVYYYKLTKKNPELLLTAIALLEKAILQKNTKQAGGPNIINLMQSELDNLKSRINQNNIKETLESKKKVTSLSDELQFYKKNKLFINLCFGCELCEQGFRDNLIPKYVINAQAIDFDELHKFKGFPKKIYFSFKMLNQIFEDFAVARKLIWLYKNDDFEDTDSLTNYIYTLDYVKNSIKYGYVKTSFSKLYNILDKIAYLIFYYFDKEKDSIYFSDIHCSEIKENIIETNNNQFLALYSLSNDFNEGGMYNNLRSLRNKIIHSFLNFSNNCESSFEIKECDFYSETIKLFGIVKAALVYFINAVDFEGKKYDEKITQQKSIYFQKDF